MPKPIIVSYSELDTYRQCPLKHQLAYVQRWTKEAPEGKALARGTLWHQVMDAHYSTIKAAQQRLPGFSVPKSDEAEVLAECWVAVQPLLFDPISGQQTEDQKLIEWMYRGYVEVYGADRDWQVLEVERSTQIPLPGESGRASSRYRLKVKIDHQMRVLTAAQLARIA